MLAQLTPLNKSNGINGSDGWNLRRSRTPYFRGRSIYAGEQHVRPGRTTLTMATIKLIISTSLFLIAVLSVQNAAPAVLSFFLWQSIAIPVGVLLTLSLCVGLMLSTILFPVRSRQ